MIGTIEISYDDGSKENIILDRIIELNIAEDRPKSLCFNQLTNGNWVITATRHLLNGRTINNVQYSKDGQENTAE